MGGIHAPTQRGRKNSSIASAHPVSARAPGSVEDGTATSLTHGSTQWYHRRSISTLDPTKLTAEDYIDLSCRSKVHVTLPAHNHSRDPSSRALLSPDGSLRLHEAFPPGTRGFLYYHIPWGPPLAGELRFRLTPTADPASFAMGSDLAMAVNGRPWHIPLYNVPLKSGSRALQAQLLQDGLVSQRTFDVLSSAAGLGSHPARTRIVSAFGQDFFLKLRGLTQLMLVGADSIVKCLLEMGARTGVLSSHGTWQSEGTAVCCFERSALPEHEGKRVVVLRIKRILDADAIHPAPSPHVGAALLLKDRRRQEDGLLMNPVHGKMQAWAVDVDETRTATRRKLGSMLKVLFENEARYGQFPQETS